MCGGGPSLPPPIPALPPPSRSDQEVKDAAAKERERNRKRVGRSGSILTGPLGITEDANVLTKKLGE